MRDLFFMDYVDPNIGWNGVLEIRALSRSDVARVLIAYDAYRDPDVYPPDLPAQLAELDLALEAHDVEELLPTVSVEGGEGARVVRVAQHAD